MTTTTVIHTVGAKGARGRYGAVIPSGATVVSVTRDGVPVEHILFVQARKTRVSEPHEGAGWADGKIKIELEVK